jgi:hypothetical protein
MVQWAANYTSQYQRIEDQSRRLIEYMCLCKWMLLRALHAQPRPTIPACVTCDTEASLCVYLQVSMYTPLSFLLPFSPT